MCKLFARAKGFRRRHADTAPLSYDAKLRYSRRSRSTSMLQFSSLSHCTRWLHSVSVRTQSCTLKDWSTTPWFGLCLAFTLSTAPGDLQRTRVQSREVSIYNGVIHGRLNSSETPHNFAQNEKVEKCQPTKTNRKSVI